MKSLLPALLVLVTATSTASAQCPDSERRRLEEFDRSWGDATLRGDRAALQSIIAEDYLDAGVGGRQNKSEMIEQAMRAADANRANPNAPRTTFDHYIISCTPTTATLTHRNATPAVVNGRPTTFYSRSVHVLEKRGGKWLVVGNAGYALDDAALLRFVELDWNEAARTRDSSWFEQNYASDATVIHARAGATIMNKAQEIAALKSDRFAIEALDLSDLAVRVDGNSAIVTGVNRIRGKDAAGKAVDLRVRFTDTFIKRDGRWLVWASQGTLIPEAPAARANGGTP